jgi:hypothetical protein
MSTAPPLPNSYWVQPGRLLAGEYPGEPDDPVSRERLRRLLRAGVSFFLDLTRTGEYGVKSYLPVLREVAGELGLAATYQRMPIRDRGTPTAEEMARTLDAIDAALAAGETVFVHLNVY